MQIGVDEALEALGLEPGATKTQIVNARRDLAQIYHPDRLADHPRLASIAENKMKAVNAAADTLLAALRNAESASADHVASGTDNSPRESHNAQTERDASRAQEAWLVNERLQILSYSVLDSLGSSEA